MSEPSSAEALLPRDDEVIPSRKDMYMVIKLLGKGGYGAVYEVRRRSDDQNYAMKVEAATVKKFVLSMDCKVMQATAAQRSRHFARPVDRGRIQDRFTFLVMKLLGPNLWDLRVERDDQRFTMNTALKAAEQTFIAIENLHRAGFLHRDIKPGNFAIGRVEENEHHIIYMLDFGLSRKFDGKDKDIRLPRDVAPFRGTTRYAPLAAMRAKEQSRKDDIEGWLYMVLEWTSGGLPWAEFNSERRDVVLRMKEEAREVESARERLYRNCPRKHFEKILAYIDSLSYVDIPDYKFVHIILVSAYKAHRIGLTDGLDWDPSCPYTGPREVPGDGCPPPTSNRNEQARTTTHESVKKANEEPAEKSSMMRTPSMSAAIDKSAHNKRKESASRRF